MANKNLDINTIFQNETENTYIMLAETFSMIGKYDMAIKVCKDALNSNPSGYLSLYELIKIYITIDNRHESEELIFQLKSMINNNSSHIEFIYWVCSGHLYLRKNQIHLAYESFAKAYRLRIREDNYFSYGLVLFYDAIDRSDISGKILLRNYRSYAAYELNIYTLFRLGVIYKDEDYHKMAFKIFNFLLKKSDLGCLTKTDIKIQLIHITIKKGDNYVALRQCYNMLKYNKRYVFVYKLLFWIYFKQSEFKKLYDHQQKIEGQFDSPYLYYVTARACVELNKIDKAFEYYKKANIVDKNNEWFWNSLGILYQKNKQYEEARNKYMIALEYNKNFKECQHNLANLLIFLNTPEKEINKYIEGGYINKDLLQKKPNPNFTYHEVDADISKSPYFKAQLFLHGPLYYYDKNKSSKYIIPIDEFFTSKF